MALLTRQERGREAERAAAAYLERAGLAIVARNWRCRHGELDLVARDGATVVFVEVRARASAGFGGARGSIDHRKRAKLVTTAGAYLARFREPPPCRFDAVLLEGTVSPRITWVRNAFEV